MPLGLGRRLRSRGTISSPIGIPNLVQWCRADLGWTAVSGSWADQSGNSTNYVQGVAAQVPTQTATAVGGQTALRFDGAFATSPDYLPCTSLGALLTTGVDVFLVGKVDNDPASAADTSGLWTWHTTSQHYASIPYTDGVIYDVVGMTTGNRTVGNPTPACTSPWLYNVISVSGEWTARFNGTQLFTDGTNTPSIGSTTYLGRSLRTFGAPFNTYLKGYIAEIIVFSAKVSTGDRSALEAYVASRYGISIP